MTLLSLSPQAAHSLVAQGALLIDIRSAAEHAGERIEQARHMPLDQLAGVRLDASGGAVIFHCRSGHRTQANAAALVACVGGEAYVLDYNDGEVPDDQEIRMRVADVIRKVKPNIIITHHRNSMHKDHATTHRIVNDARYFAAIPTFERELPAHFAAKLYYGENWEDAVDYVPYVYVDFNQEAFDLWIKALSTHWFVTGSKSFNYMDYYKSLARVRGLEARKEYAETFMVAPESMKLRQSEL